MTMVQKLRSQVSSLGRVARRVCEVVLIAVSVVASARAADPPVHFSRQVSMPPGAIGSTQLLRGGPLPGYFQPVEIRAPRGAVISTAESGQFEDPKPAPVVAGLLIGSVYRLRVTNIPNQLGMEVYPTIEVIDRLYPPMGMEFKFPIPIELTQEELELALAGKFVMRVIYLEEPDAATPVAQQPDDQPYFEAADGQNPVDVADTLGRPMAIVRIGGRLPDAQGPDETFMYGSPPLMKWRPASARETVPILPGQMGRSPSTRRNASLVTATARERVPVVRGPATR